ncbi:MAG TPA: PAS domain S-box protein [Sideroxyarcus sp.]|nr:PAS domain S-box protein [Sideroxyarcus sp.]
MNQLEIELLSEALQKLRNGVSSNCLNRQNARTSVYGYFFLDALGRICDATVSGNDTVHERRRKWLGKHLHDCLPHDRRAQFQDFLDEVFATDGKKSHETRLDAASSKKMLGNTPPEYVAIEAISDKGRRYCLAVVEDISARKAAEENEKTNRAALDLLRHTIAASRNEIFMFDADSLKFTFASNSALENLGYTMDELMGLTPADIQNALANEEMANLINDLLINKVGVRKFNATHLRKDGSLYPVEMCLQLLEQESGASFIAIALDVSKQAAVESQLRSIVESAGAIIWAADTHMKLVYISDQMREILGYGAEQFIGRTWHDMLGMGLVHENDQTLLQEGFNRALIGEQKVANLGFRAKHADGTWRWLNLNMTPNRMMDGRIGQIVGVMHDMHAQKLIEDELVKLNHELDSRVQEEIEKNREKDLLLQRQSRLAGMGEMIGNIAHQWRQPINSLSLILSDLEDAALFSECDLAYIQTAVAKSKTIIQKMSTTIDDFRHFFRADKSPGDFSLRQVTDECLNLVDAAMKSSHIEIIRNEADVIVSGFANEYSQALMNILSNARDAIVARGRGHGHIHIDIRAQGDWGVHTISDDGGGIPPEALPRIFEPHFTTKEYGVGIGLYMSMVSVEKNMKGRIEVENRADGASFSIYLPKARSGGNHG